MSACCEPRGYDRVFTEGMARHEAARFRRRGAGRQASRIVALYRLGVLAGSSVLDVGAGIGDLDIELLRAGMHVATAVELSDAYTAVAEQLAREAGFVPDEGMVASTDSSSVDARSASDPLDAATASDPLDAASSGNSGDVATSTRPRRIRRLIGDLAVNPHLAEPTDIVVLAKVVCCYADATRLLAAAGALARRHLVLVYPRPWRVLRPFAQASGWLARRRGSDWRFHVHPEADLMAALAAAGLAVTRTEGRVLWRIVVATRITLWHPLPEPGGNARESALPAHLQWRTHF